MNYLNPSPAHVEHIEAMQAAKFVHWAQNDAAHRTVQLAFRVEVFKKNMFNRASTIAQMGRTTSLVCLWRTSPPGPRTKRGNFRGAWRERPSEALLKLGEREYQTTLVTLRKKVDRLLADGSLGKRS